MSATGGPAEDARFPNASAAWRSAVLPLINRPTLEICGVDPFVNGTYKALLPEEGPPLFYADALALRSAGYAGRTMTLWLYLDRGSRWRVAYAPQKDRMLGADVGFLRSGTVAPGTLPSSASDWEVFAASGWSPQRGASVVGATYEHDWPDLVVTLGFPADAKDVADEDGLVAARFHAMSGAELATLRLDPNKELVSGLRTSLAEALRMPRRKVKVVLADGRLLGDAEDASVLSSILAGPLPEKLPEPASGPAALAPPAR